MSYKSNKFNALLKMCKGHYDFETPTTLYSTAKNFLNWNRHEVYSHLNANECKRYYKLHNIRLVTPTLTKCGIHDVRGATGQNDFVHDIIHLFSNGLQSNSTDCKFNNSFSRKWLLCLSSPSSGGLVMPLPCGPPTSSCMVGHLKQIETYYM